MATYAYCPDCGGFVAGHVEPTDAWRAAQEEAGLRLEECEGRKIEPGCQCGDDAVIRRLRVDLAKSQAEVATLRHSLIEELSSAEQARLKIAMLRKQLTIALDDYSRGKE